MKLKSQINAIAESESYGFFKEPDKGILNGLSGEKILGSLQRLTALLANEPNVCYLEVGVFQGLTL